MSITFTSCCSSLPSHPLPHTQRPRNAFVPRFSRWLSPRGYFYFSKQRCPRMPSREPQQRLTVCAARITEVEYLAGSARWLGSMLICVCVHSSLWSRKSAYWCCSKVSRTALFSANTTRTTAAMITALSPLYGIYSPAVIAAFTKAVSS